MAGDIGWEKLLSAGFWKEMNDLYTMMPATVISVVDDFKEQRINVQPSLNKLFSSGESAPRASIINVPVIMPATSTSAITMPLNEGDTVWLMFSMRAMEIFMESDGKPSTPNNYSKFDQKDAVAIVGLFPRKKAINNPNKRTHEHSTKDLVIAHNIGKPSEVEIRLKPDGSLIINSPTSVIVNCKDAEVNAESSASITTPQLTVDANTTDWTGDINLNGNITQSGSQTVSGDVVASGKSLVSHTHIGSPTAPNGAVSPTGAPN